jgi:hypothetical protein
MVNQAASAFRRAGRTLALWWARLLLGFRQVASAAWRIQRRTGRRIRIAIGVGLVVAITLTWLGVTTASMAAQARTDLQELIDEASTMTLNSFAEPATYLRLAEQSEQAGLTASHLKQRVGLLRSVEFIPVLGRRVAATRNTVDLALDLASAASILLTAYGNAVDERRAGGVEAVTASLEEQAVSLEEALAQLDRAQIIVSRPLVLSDREAILANASVGVLRTMAVVALEDPAVVDAGLGLVNVVIGLQALVGDPKEALLSPGKASDLISELRARAEKIAATLTAISEDSALATEPMLLALDGLAVLSAGAEAAGALLGVAEAVQSGPFSERFGADVGPKLITARLEIVEANRLLGILQGRFAEGLAAELSDALDFSSDGVFAPAQRILTETGEVTDAVWTILGYDQPQTYLLILQNQQEIRATGGFIGATVELHLDSGVLGGLVADDSVFVDSRPLIDNPVPPEPIFWYLWMGRLLFRDSNWNPHFPDAALQVTELYQRGHPGQIDGVIAATKLLGLDLVGALGEVEVAGRAGPLTRELASKLSEGEVAYECTAEHAATRGKRCFDEDLVPAILERLREGHDEAGRIALIDLFLDHLERKTILFNFTDASAQALIASNHWDGAIPKPAQDLIMVVDSSFPGHTTAEVQRSIDYHVSLSIAGPSRAELRVRYSNRRIPEPGGCRQADQGQCYWNYFRVLVPGAAENLALPSIPLHEGAERLIWGYREIDSAQVVSYGGEGLEGLQEVGGFIAVAPGRVLTVPIDYDLRPGLVQRVEPGHYEYRLQLVKQPGMDADIFDIELELPPGARLIAASPADATFERGVVRLTIQLRQDTELVVLFEASA